MELDYGPSTIKKTENCSSINLRNITLYSVRPQKLIWRRRMVLLLKRLYQPLQKLPITIRHYFESTDPNYVVDRLILTAVFVIFFVAVILFQLMHKIKHF